MKHDNCTHPATPKDRAACRKAQATVTASVVDTGIPEFVPAADKPILERARAKMAERRLDEAVSNLHKATPRTKRDPDLIDTLARLRKLSCPAEWEGQLHHAWNHGWSIRHEELPKTATAPGQRLVISAPKGIVTLVWATDGRTAFWFKPEATSVARQCASLPIAMSLGEGRR